MQYLVSVDHNGLAEHVTRCDGEGVQEVLYVHGMDGTDDNVLWNSSEEEENVRSECEEDEGTFCEGGDSDTDWLKVVRI